MISTSTPLQMGVSAVSSSSSSSCSDSFSTFLHTIETSAQQLKLYSLLQTKCPSFSSTQRKELSSLLVSPEYLQLCAFTTTAQNTKTLIHPTTCTGMGPSSMYYQFYCTSCAKRWYRRKPEHLGNERFVLSCSFCKKFQEGKIDPSYVPPSHHHMHMHTGSKRSQTTPSAFPEKRQRLAMEHAPTNRLHGSTSSPAIPSSSRAKHISSSFQPMHPQSSSSSTTNMHPSRQGYGSYASPFPALTSVSTDHSHSASSVFGPMFSPLLHTDVPGQTHSHILTPPSSSSSSSYTLQSPPTLSESTSARAINSPSHAHYSPMPMYSNYTPTSPTYSPPQSPLSHPDPESDTDHPLETEKEKK